jgi:predicted metal-dependent phosphoesterase TrpH
LTPGPDPTSKGKTSNLLRADLHIHSAYSMDCSTSLDEIIERCNQTGINCVAIADHGTAEGSLALKKMDALNVIIAEEILTDYGEIIGLFLQETIPSGLSAEETVFKIKDQGGLVCIPHPFDVIRPSALKYECLVNIVDDIDVIEVFNARNHFTACNDKAKKFAREFNKLSSAGSDAHTANEIGKTYIEMPEFKNRDDFINSLSQGIIHGHLSSPFVHFNSTASKLKKRFIHYKES